MRDVANRGQRCGRGGNGADGLEIEPLEDQLGKPLERRWAEAVFAGRHQAQVPLGDGQRRIVRQRPEGWQAGRVADGRGRRSRVRVAADAVQDHPCQPDARLHALAAEHHRGGGRAHAEHVQHEQDWRVERASYGRGARVLRAADAVEQAHHAFDDGDVRAAHAPLQHSQQGRFRQQPRVQVARGPPSGEGVQRGIDVVRPRLEGRDAPPLPPQRREQSDGDGRFANRRMGAGQQHARHVAQPSSGAHPTQVSRHRRAGRAADCPNRIGDAHVRLRRCR